MKKRNNVRSNSLLCKWSVSILGLFLCVLIEIFVCPFLFRSGRWGIFLLSEYELRLNERKVDFQLVNIFSFQSTERIESIEVRWWKFDTFLLQSVYFAFSSGMKKSYDEEMLHFSILKMRIFQFLYSFNFFYCNILMVLLNTSTCDCFKKGINGITLSQKKKNYISFFYSQERWNYSLFFLIRKCLFLGGGVFSFFFFDSLFISSSVPSRWESIDYAAKKKLWIKQKVLQIHFLNLIHYSLKYELLKTILFSDYSTVYRFDTRTHSVPKECSILVQFGLTDTIYPVTTRASLLNI